MSGFSVLIPLYLRKIYSSVFAVAVRPKARVCGGSVFRIAGSKPAGHGCFVCCECCVLSGRGLCKELLTRPKESYHVRYVVV